MLKLTKLSALLPHFKSPEGSEKKPAWGKQSHIDMLANGLVRDQEGWIVDRSAISRNGVIIAWKGSLEAGSTVVTVTMDGQRFVTTPSENMKLKSAIAQFLHAKVNPHEIKADT